ncbi:biliverdin-producing heme oxygenase [Caulobacter sp.]|uniref:biliverdin-producing heme oxygenase n=1 Tax=Caulobacter sp. TaxID=78 RepID=UPI002B4A6D2E|nr:biliverdin-producing heme oxygenase [Caulobacter sp.]HJV42845.1 biliverdin-producing heme oxygenase [Caulobacter sp.]
MSENLLRDRLRAVTSKSHAGLDALAAALDLETRAGYCAFLSASAAALAPLELALELAGVEGWLADWPHRARRAALARDLSALGLPQPRLLTSTIPSAAFGAGVLYVLEGSRLGARFLARQVRRADPQAPLAYLTHGEGQDLWRSFLTWLEAQPKVGWRTDESEAGARYGFQCFSAAFETVFPPGGLNVRAGVHARV